MNELRVLVALVGVGVAGILFPEAARAQTPAEFDRLLDGLPVVDEIDPAAQPPVHQFPEDASRVAMVLTRPARELEAADSPKVMACGLLVSLLFSLKKEATPTNFPLIRSSHDPGCTILPRTKNIGHLSYGVLSGRRSRLYGMVSSRRSGRPCRTCEDV